MVSITSKPSEYEFILFELEEEYTNKQTRTHIHTYIHTFTELSKTGAISRPPRRNRRKPGGPREITKNSLYQLEIYTKKNK